MMRLNCAAPYRFSSEKCHSSITQGDLIARLQVLGIMMDQSTLPKIENQQRPVTDIELVALAKALKVSTGWLLGE